MKLGSPQADAAYDRWHDRQADAYFAPDPVCPWCGCSCDEEGECWLWTGSTDRMRPCGRGGYGSIRDSEDGQRLIGAHRMAWKLFRGEIPAGMEVAHRCDVRNCVNPGHLWLATHAENIADRERHRRLRKSASSTAHTAERSATG